MAIDLLLSELTAYDPGLPGTTTLRYATGEGHTTGPAETPANTIYDARIISPADVKRDLFANGGATGRSKIGLGDLILRNADGGLDVLLTYGFSGRDAIMRRGVPKAAYPSGFPTMIAVTMEQPEVQSDNLIIKLRDNQFGLDRPFQPNKYLGNNALPSGLEGTADIQGKPKPIALGWVRNAPLVNVNTAKLIFQVTDGAVLSIPGVYDQAVPFAQMFPLTSRTSQFSTDGIRSAAYGWLNHQDVTVMVGVNGKLSTSTDCKTWTAHTSGFGASTINAVCYGEGLFVAVGQAGKLFTSPDGANWTTRTSQFGATDILAVCYGNGIFVAVGGAGKVSTSPDGLTWTAQTSGFGANNISCVVWGAGLFVAGGISGGVSFVQTSPDGVTWQTRTYPNNGAVTLIAYVPGWFLSYSSSGTVKVSSPDGITWTAIPTNLTSSNGVLGLYTHPDGSFHAVGSSAGAFWRIELNANPGFAYPSAVEVRTSTGLSGSTYVALFHERFGELMVAGDTGQLYSTTNNGSEGDYASLAALQDDTLAPSAGKYKTYLAGGYVRLGSSPSGDMTADVYQINNTLSDGFLRLFFLANVSPGTNPGNYIASDLTTLQITNDALVGYWTNEETTFADVLDAYAMTLGLWWGTDYGGRIRVQQFLAPAGPAVVSFTENDIKKGSLTRVAATDETKGLPSWRTIVRYARNYFVQSGGIAGGFIELEAETQGGPVTAARRAFISQEWREVKTDNTAVQTVHLLAAQTAEESLFQYQYDAQLEADRRQTLRGTLRNRFQIEVQLNDESLLADLGTTISLSHPRYGLSAGVLFRVLGVDPDTARRRIVLTLWG